MPVFLGNLSICIVIHPFWLAQEKNLRVLKNFSKRLKMHAIFCLICKSRSSEGGGGSAALPAAAAFVGSKKERSVHAAAATAKLRVAATAYSGTPGALAASAVGCTAIVSVSNGSLAGAATDLLDAMLVEGMEEPDGVAIDLLDALNSECIEELSGPATIVLGDNGGCAAVESDLHGTFNSRSVFSSIVSWSIVHVEDHGGAASVQGDTGSVAFS